MVTTPITRAQRRRLARPHARRGTTSPTRRWRTSALALGAAAVLGFGVIGGTGVALAEDPPAVEMSPEMILDLLDNEMLTGFVEMCRTGALANGNPAAGQSTAWNPEDTQQGQLPPGAIATCSDSTGHGLALVLPDTFEIGQMAEGFTMDLGDDINLLLIRYVMGERNLIEVIGGLALGSSTIKGIANGIVGIPIDPSAFNKYDSYAQIQADAALPYVEERYCDGFMLFGNCVGTWRYRDKNQAKREEALKMAEFLTGHRYDYSQPTILPDLPKLEGKSLISGEGINVALSMRKGNAIAQTGNSLAVALAGADHGNTSSVYAKYGIGTALNMDTDDIQFTWFGQPVKFENLLALLNSDMAKDAIAEMTPEGEEPVDIGAMLEMIEGLNQDGLPGLKEVFCLGLDVKATAEGLGSCTNFLGTFDTYKDLRPLTNGSENPAGDGVSRQEQYGLTDISSLIFGNDALLKDFLPLLAGGEDADMGALLGNPTVAKMLGALLSEEDRIKLTKDFIRYTKNVETTFAKEPVMIDSGETDDDGNPIMVEKKEQVTDADGNLLWEDVDGKRYTQAAIDADDDLDVADLSPVMATVMKNKTTPRMVGAVEDAWETYTDTNDPVMVDDEDENGDPIFVDADGNVVDADTEGATKKQVQKVDADGNPVFKEKTRHFTRPAMVESTDAAGNVITEDYKDADGNVVWLDENGDVVEEGTEGAVKKQTPVLVQKMEQAKDSKGNLLWDPVVEKSTTAHWLTSDYGLREPLVIEWMGHQVVFFPAVEVNGAYRPNLMGLPQISKITQDAHTGLLPKISLVQWDNAFGLGTWSFDKPWDLFGTAKNFTDSITLHKDLKQIDDLLGITDGIKDSLGLGKNPAPVDPDVTDPDVTDPGEGEGTEPGDEEVVDQLDSLTTLDGAPESTPSAPSTTPAAPDTESTPAPEPELGVTPSAPATPEAPAVDTAPAAPTGSDPAPEPELAGVGAGSSDDGGLSLE